MFANRGTLFDLLRRVNIGINGRGTVGGGAIHALRRICSLMTSRRAGRINVAKIAVRSLEKVLSV